MYNLKQNYLFSWDFLREELGGFKGGKEQTFPWKVVWGGQKYPSGAGVCVFVGRGGTERDRQKESRGCSLLGRGWVRSKRCGGKVQNPGSGDGDENQLPREKDGGRGRVEKWMEKGKPDTWAA